MADDIAASSVGSSPLYFPLMPNWATLPGVQVIMPRDYVNFPGTAQLMVSTTDRIPIEFSITFQVDNKQDEYELLDFIHTVKGKAYRFWIEHPVHLFDLVETVPSGASSIKVSLNDFQKVANDDDRIFMAMKNGDLIVRTITNSVEDVDGITCTIDEVLTREITTDDYWVIGRFLLCRLKEDAFKQKIESKNVTTYTVGFTELPYEMAEQGAS